MGTGFEPVYTDLQSVASPLGQPTAEAVHLRADDEARTRDLNLGKVALYQLSYVRIALLRESNYTQPRSRARRTAVWRFSAPSFVTAEER